MQEVKSLSNYNFLDYFKKKHTFYIVMCKKNSLKKGWAKVALEIL